MSNQMPIDISDYLERREAGVIIPTKIGPEHYSVVIKNFDARTGKEVAPVVPVIAISQLVEVKAKLEAEKAEKERGIADVEAMIKDLLELEKKTDVEIS